MTAGNRINLPEVCIHHRSSKNDCIGLLRAVWESKIKVADICVYYRCMRMYISTYIWKIAEPRNTWRGQDAETPSRENQAGSRWRQTGWVTGFQGYEGKWPMLFSLLSVARAQWKHLKPLWDRTTLSSIILYGPLGWAQRRAGCIAVLTEGNPGGCIPHSPYHTAGHTEKKIQSNFPRINIAEMPLLCDSVSRLSATTIKIPVSLQRNRKIIHKSRWRYERSQVTNTILIQKNKARL